MYVSSENSYLRENFKKINIKRKENVDFTFLKSHKAKTLSPPALPSSFFFIFLVNCVTPPCPHYWHDIQRHVKQLITGHPEFLSFKVIKLQSLLSDRLWVSLQMFCKLVNLFNHLNQVAMSQWKNESPMNHQSPMKCLFTIYYEWFKIILQEINKWNTLVMFP